MNFPCVFFPLVVVVDRLEEKQRASRRKREAEAESAASNQMVNLLMNISTVANNNNG